MTIHDLRCDACGTGVATPDGGIRFVYHPGKPQLRDASGLMCRPCWDDLRRVLTGPPAPRRCAVCGQAVTPYRSLYVRGFDEPRSRQLCASHAVAFLNSLRTVQPKIDPATFRFPFAHLDANSDAEPDADPAQR